jgi:hypothetical protein
MNEFFRYTKQLCKTPFNKEPEKLIETFNKMNKQALNGALIINQIKSSSVFPEIITNDDGYFLDWDIQYWIYFDSFLFELSLLLDNPSYKDNFIKNTHNLFYDFLSFKFIHIPELAYCLQVVRKNHFGIERTNNCDISENTYKRYIYGDFSGVRVQARWLAFCHELYHVYYKLNPEVKQEDIKRLSNITKFHVDHDYLKSVEHNGLGGILKSGFDMLLNSDVEKLLEEASCDYRALIEVVSIYRKMNEEIENVYICQIHDAFHINQVFLNYLVNIYSCWQTLYTNYLKVEAYEELIEKCLPPFDKAAQMAIIRNSIIPDFLDKLNIGKYNIGSYKSVLDNDFMKTVFREMGDGMMDLNFMFYIIEESIKISNNNKYNPFELKEIVLKNAGYIKE